MTNNELPNLHWALSELDKSHRNERGQLREILWLRFAVLALIGLLVAQRYWGVL